MGKEIVTQELSSKDKIIQMTSAYDWWVQNEGVPIIKGYFVEDINKVPVEPWHRKGGLGAFINLIGHERTNDAYICVIPPGKSLKIQKHLYEEMVLVLEGEGKTDVFDEAGSKQTFEWRAWDLFSIPLNFKYQHHNRRKDKPVKYLAVTTAPLVIGLFHNTDFVFNNNFVFKDRYNGEQNYFKSKGTLHDVGYKVWESNFIPNVRKMELYDWKGRGEGGAVMLEIAENTLTAHIAEFEVGTYKKAHRHGGGANIITLSDTGYTLMWSKGQPKMKIDWQVGTLMVPPQNWFHQHFNTGKEPARYMALRWKSRKYPMWGGILTDSYKNIKEGGTQIEFEDEDPEIRNMYRKELAKVGAEWRMSKYFPSK
ncbi:MAG: ethanolamine ammonia lyase-activating protein [Thermodesulfobacteriota bacterium]|nr:ethanolamine ammonia lyase-activating protein [Thermodesulfobacteriota bacterium]